MVNDFIERWTRLRDQREDQIFLVLTILIGALVGLAVAAFIVLTERLGMRLYPVGNAWQRPPKQAAYWHRPALEPYNYAP